MNPFPFPSVGGPSNPTVPPWNTAGHPPATPAPALDPVRAVLDRSLHSLAALGGDLIGHANRIGAILWSPPRVVIVGRLKAGKSTLVNALIGAPVAETAALEATNVVAVYADGAPSRAEIVGLDGTRRPVHITPGTPLDLGCPATEIAYIDRWIPSQAIRDLTLIDTPGLATLTVENETATRRALIDGFEQTRAASVNADAAVFLFDSVPRTDELDFLRQLDFTPLNTLGVLSRADGFGEGPLGQRDPIAHAAEHTTPMARELSGAVGAVLPVAGLLAETALTGRLTESDARALATLAGREPFALIEGLDSDSPTPLDEAARDRLLDLVGEYGLVHGRTVAAGGAHALTQWLATVSGIERFRQELHTSLARFAAIQRAGRILTELDTLAFQHPARDHIRTIVDTTRRDPAMNQVVLFGCLRAMLGVDPDSPVVDELTRVLLARNDTELLEIPATAGPDQVLAAAGERLAWTQHKALSTMSAAEDAALAALNGTYAGICRRTPPR